MAVIMEKLQPWP